MKRSIWSERNLVVALFIMVIVIFSFAQADSTKVEKTFLDDKAASTSSNDQSATSNHAATAPTTFFKNSQQSILNVQYSPASDGTEHLSFEH